MLTPLAYEGRRGLFVWKYLLKYVIYNREGKNSQMKDDRVEITDMDVPVAIKEYNNKDISGYD